MPRLLLAERSPLYCHALACLFEQPAGVEVVGAVRQPDEALRLCQQKQPDVLVLGEGLAPTGGQLCRRLKQARLPVCLVVLIDTRDHQLLYELVAEGVAGFIAPEDEPGMAREAVRAVAHGADAWFSPCVAAALLGPGSADQKGLSERQRQIVQHAAMGHSNEEIAEALHLAEGTIRNHLSRIYRMVGVHTRAELVAWAWRNRIVRV